MSSPKGGTNESGDKSLSHDFTSSAKGRELECFFHHCPYPNEAQEIELVRYLGVPLEQLKEWFRNRRTQAQLPQSESEFHIIVEAFPADATTANDGSDVNAMEKARLLAIAYAAGGELHKLVITGEPLWRKSFTDGRLVLNGETYKRMFPRDMDPNVFKAPGTREESSKASISVGMEGQKLVQILLHPAGLIDFFPTIVQKAEIIKLYEGGAEETRDGAMLLMHVELHSLSPHVSSRDYFFLRYCRVIHEGVWLITDVSFDSIGESLPHLPSWKLPSGCLIVDMRDGTSMVTWVEHVEANDRDQTSIMYRDIVRSNIPYGAERWVLVLQRSVDKHKCYKENNAAGLGQVIPLEGRRSLLELSERMVQDFSTVLNTAGKPGITNLTRSNNQTVKFSIRINSGPGCPKGLVVTMVTSIWLPITPHYVFQFLTDLRKRNEWDILSLGLCGFEVKSVPTGNNLGNCLSVIRGISPSKPTEMVTFQETYVDPMASYIVFSPIEVANMDLLLNGSDSSQVPILPCGFVIANDHSLPRAGGMAIGTGMAPHRPDGTLLTVAYQLLACDRASTRHLRMEFFSTTQVFFRATINKIKIALGCSDMG